eukprot:scaffold172104_cov18-Tisochrysis_lutea.AAC.1
MQSAYGSEATKQWSWKGCGQWRRFSTEHVLNIGDSRSRALGLAVDLQATEVTAKNDLHGRFGLISGQWSWMISILPSPVAPVARRSRHKQIQTTNCTWRGTNGRTHHIYKLIQMNTATELHTETNKQQPRAL